MVSFSVFVDSFGVRSFIPALATSLDSMTGVVRMYMQLHSNV